MKTPMQELLEWVRATLPMDLETPRLIEEKIEAMLEEEEDYRQRMREIVAQELHNLGMLTDRAIDQAAFESEYGYSSTNYNSFKEGVKWIIEQFELFNKNL